MPRRIVLGVVSVSALVLGVVGTAFACTPLPRSFLIAPDVGAAKTMTTVTGQGLRPRTPVEVLWGDTQGRVIGSVITDERGEFALPVTVPDVVPGAYAVVFMAPTADALGMEGVTVDSVAVGRLPFRLAPAAAASPIGGLPGPSPDLGQQWSGDPRRTRPNSDSGQDLVLAVGISGLGIVVVAGGSALVGTRRRRRSSSPA
ncbi:MAG: hypothetical protein ACT4OS_09060 [Acidimicrobiales bacterium]